MLYDDVEFSGGAALKAAVLEMEADPYHMHKDVLEIVFTLEGAVELTVVNNVLRMEEGDIYICSSNELHCLQAIEETENLVLLLHVNLSIYKPEFPDINTYQFANSAIERNRTGVQILGSYLKKQLPRFMAGERADLGMLREIGDNILRILIREFQCYNLGKGYPEFNKTYRDNEVQLGRVRRISDYIYANYNQPIKVEDAAATEHISANHLTHIMKNGTGVSFRTFLNLARVEKSATLLLENEKSLQAVAYECGFSKYKYFAASFEKSFRMSPQQYREKYKDRTIFRQRGRFRQLEGEELETWLKSLSGTREELFLDLSQPRRESAFFKPGCVNLWGFRYDHVTDFPLLRDLRKKMSFEMIGIDDDFLRRYRSSPRAMSYILTDFQALQVGLRIHISSRTTPQLLEDFLCRLESLWGRPVPGMAEFFISAAEPEDAQARRLKRMVERRGIAVDVSHLNDKGFDDLVHTAKKPFIATHSNLRAVCGHKRNLPDDQFREIVRRGGIVGINFCKAFLNDDKEKAGFPDLVRHIERMLMLGGEDVIAMGSDFDGTTVPEGMESVEKLADVERYLLKAGLGEKQTEKIMGGNACAFFRRMWG